MSARECKPGDVAIIRWTWTSGQERALCIGGKWSTESGVYVWHKDVTDVRPLVVIDPEDREQVERLVSDLRQRGIGQMLMTREESQRAGSVDDVMAGHVADTLREFANPTPPKPAEPTGLGAVVEDAEGRRWLTVGGPQQFADEWYSPDLNTRARWGDIDAVRVLSEGVTA